MAGLYVHIPFCRKRCNYCDFYKECLSGEDGQLSAYIDALGREMEFRRGFFEGDPVDTIYFGGGTPSVCEPPLLQGVIDRARDLWNFGPLAEVTAEVNPDDATPEYLARLADTEVNRISFGVQSFMDRDLLQLNRRHTGAQAVEAVKNARKAGFSNITIDLIYGIPGMSAKDWDRNMMQALSLGVEHISAYHLTVEPGTEFARLVSAGAIDTVDEEVSEMQYALISSLLYKAGFDHYEISNYARTPELRAIHNSNYWKGGKYLGLGPSAHSYNGRDRREFVISSLDEYLKGAGTGSIYKTENLSTSDKYNEYVMVSLRTVNGVRRDVIYDRFGGGMLLYFEYAAKESLRKGLLVREGNEYRIPTDKFMVSDAVIRDLFFIREE